MDQEKKEGKPIGFLTHVLANAFIQATILPGYPCKSPPDPTRRTREYFRRNGIFSLQKKSETMRTASYLVENQRKKAMETFLHYKNI